VRIDNRSAIRIYTKTDNFKVGSLVPHLLIDSEYDVITGKRDSIYIFTWNWICQGAGKQRRGRGNFKTIEDAKKALLKACGYNESDLNFIEVPKVTA
jgi:hypothetical protein